jgi:hypothetical protein
LKIKVAITNDENSAIVRMLKKRENACSVVKGFLLGEIKDLEFSNDFLIRIVLEDDFSLR